jgi:hypothetical protein
VSQVVVAEVARGLAAAYPSDPVTIHDRLTRLAGTRGFLAGSASMSLAGHGKRLLAGGVALLTLLAACFSNSSAPATGGGSQTSSTGGSSGGIPSDAGAGAGDGASSAPLASTTAPATIMITGTTPVTAPPTSYGHNYWDWVSSYGDQVAEVQSGATAMKLNVLRAGGHNNDNNNPQPFTNDQIDTFVVYARAVGAEPILQVPLLADASDARPTAQTAADMVTYANVTQKYGIKYWEIGNEPDLYSDQGDLPTGYTAASYCSDFGTFADAMRAVDPTIQILGPELSYKYVAGNDWLTPFLTNCGSKVDIVSVHRYPFAAAASTIANAMGDGTQFRSTLTRLRTTMNSLGLASKPLAITEANFSYQGDPTLQTGTAALGTFYAGMWVADTMGIALEANVWTMAFWSLDEDYYTGFFTSDTFQPRPAAYAYELLSTHFGPTILNATTVPTGMSAYASRDDAAKKTVVLLINRTADASSQVLGFTNLTVTPSNWSVTLPAYALLLIELPDDGSAPASWLYTKAMADAEQGPQRQ